jgi:site-specific recombinase XerD
VTPLAPHITAFLRRRLPVERRASDNTCDTYAYAFRLLFEFAGQKLSIAPSDLELEHLDAPLVLAFLEHIQEVRGNGASTRNARLAAIRSFMRFIEHRVPSAMQQLRRVLAIPMQRTDARLIRHLNRQEMEAVLNVPDPSVGAGARDRAMLHVGFTAGLRVSELVGLRLDDVTFEPRYVDIHVLGKGRKERTLKLWKTVANSIRAWLAVRGEAAAHELFLNARGEPMTRSGFAYVLRNHVAIAAENCPSLKSKKVSPHVLRHTCAMNVFRATGDIRKVALWLGHSSTQTADVYTRADPGEALDTLGTVVPPMLRKGKFRPPDRLIAALTRT